MEPHGHNQFNRRKKKSNKNLKVIKIKPSDESESFVGEQRRKTCCLIRFY